MEFVRTDFAETTAPSARRTWERTHSGEYAQVPVAGTNPDVVTGNRDLNRPFLVRGNLSDEALLEIITLIRRSPDIPPLPTRSGRPLTGLFAHVEGSWPVLQLVQQADGTVEVALVSTDPDERQGQTIRLRRTAVAWTIERLAEWISD